ncbi:MAG: tetratricopeptide repeat protein [Kofleriaceae bacterium]
MKHPVVSLAAVLVVATLATPARANKADELFRQGKRLMAEKKFAEACPKLDASFKVDPEIGTELNIGRCYEEWGKLATAYRAYTDAHQRAADAKDPRTPKIQALIAKLDPNVPRLVVRIPEGADHAGLRVTIDGVAVADLSAPQLVDPGPKTIEYGLGSGPRTSRLVRIERGATAEITLELAKPKAAPLPDKLAVTAPPPPAAKPASAPTSPGHGQRVAGVVIAGAGVVTVGVSTYLALAARSNYDAALEANCMGMTNACNLQGLTDTHAARSEANTATIIGGVGLAAIAAGIVVYVISPDPAAMTEHALYLAPAAGGTGLAFGGRF